MSNKIIKLGSTEKQVETLQSNEVYLDLAQKSNKPSGKGYVISKNVNVAAIQGSLENIFSWLQGERVILPEFGSRLRKLLYEGITDYNVEQVIAEIQHCVSEWEPRVQIKQVVNVNTNDDIDDNVVHLEIIYIIPGLSDKLYSYSFITSRGN